MATNPITAETSLKTKPRLRQALVWTWMLVAGYTAAVFIVAAITYFNQEAGGEATLVASLIDTALVVVDLIVDGLIVVGFSLVAFNLLLRRSDDWMALFTSAFMIVFAGRVSTLINITATQPGYETLMGVILALGDVGIVAFNFLFPNGKLAPRWLYSLLPVAALNMLALYAIPASPIFWQKIGQIPYLTITIFWYSLAFGVFFYRYFRQANILQKQQMRWALIGLLGPFLWFLVFSFGNLLLADFLASSWLAGVTFEVFSRILSILLFMFFPLFIAISIARSRLFDIDLLINRSMVYGGLTIGLGLVFAILLGLVSLIFRTINQGDQSMLAMTVSALAAGALFQPARRKLQRFVDQFFYRIKIDYQKTPVEIHKNDDPLTGTTLSSYRGLKLIGRGGMADVYRAESPTNGKTVAIKVLPPSLAQDEQFRRRFMREAEAITDLDHPNIVRVLNFGEEDGTYYIVMEYLTGPDVRNLLKEEKRIDLPDALLLLRDVASALDYAHARGLVHRDIKPSNVMLDSSSLPPRAVLTDFGIAKIADAHTKITATGVLGTFDYIAPEQIQSSGEVNHSADIYALGVMTYQMLTGRLPFERPNTGALLLAHLTSPPPDVRETVPETPRQVAYAIQRAMAKKPEDRYPSAGEFLAAMESA
jgi:serine/threonine-protein kinase